MTTQKSNTADPGSFRDPSGFLFYHDGLIYRQVNRFYQENYDLLYSSNLYNNLVKEGLLIAHEEVDLKAPNPDLAYKVIKPEQVPFISYPYEWSFSQLKDAALTTLKIQNMALNHGLSLKDSSAYNIQFLNGKAIFIDTLSFEKYQEGSPWVAYKQFCQHFLAPLAIMSARDIRLNQLLRVYIDGVPLDLASSLLPSKSWLKFSHLSHIHLHSKSQKHFGSKTVEKEKQTISQTAVLGLVDNLQSAIRKLVWKPKGTEWAEYYDETNYSSDAIQHKKQLVSEFLEDLQPQSVWDLGANTGFFSRVASDKNIQTVSFDIDPACVEKNYQECVEKGEKNILPLLLDLTNPSPGIGWQNQERRSFLERGPVDTVLALALIHHLAITNNVPLIKTAEFFSKTCRSLIIEFVPKTDSQVARLLSTREDIFPHYTKEFFELEFQNFFDIKKSIQVKGAERTLYLMVKR